MHDLFKLSSYYPFKQKQLFSIILLELGLQVKHGLSIRICKHNPH
jgi:hypothetical protein